MTIWGLQPPAWWPVLCLLPILLWLGRGWAQTYYRALRQELGPREVEVLGVRSWVSSRMLLAGAATLLMGVALLRPVQPGREAQLAPDVVLCVDVSRSMAAGDGRPTRYDALVQQVELLLQQGIGSRFALLAFAGDVQAIAPLTADRDAVRWLLQELAPGVLPATSEGSGTNLGAAIEAAAASLERVSSVGELILLTDGEDFAGTARQAAELAAQQGHHVHCIGYGTTAGSKIVIERDGEQTFLQDGAGNDVITHLDVASLAAVAAAGAGLLVHDDAPSALLDLWREQLVPMAARRHLEARDTDVVQRFQWPLLAGLLLWMLRMCLPERRR